MPKSTYGTLSQIHSRGGLEKFLVDQPTLTFWRFQHLQHTNFAVDYVMHHLDGGNTKSKYKDIEREGDLLSEIYFVADMPALAAGHYVDSVGQLMIKEARLTIGGSCTHRLSGNYLFCWDELSGGLKKLQEMTGKYGNESQLLCHSKTKRRLYVPLPFWRSSGAALPLISLQFHKVKVELDFEDMSSLLTADADMSTVQVLNGIDTGEVTGAAPTMKDVDMYLMYGQVYLTEEERSRFADLNMEMLIEQTQDQVITGAASIKGTHDLQFNHSIRELIWAVKNAAAGDKVCPFGGYKVDVGQVIDYDVLGKVDLRVNNNSRWDADQPASYYRLVQPYQHHSCIPTAKVYSYSFGLESEEQQPSGQINFSRIDKVTLTVDTVPNTIDDDAELHIFARNWNVLVIRDGLGGLMYAS